MTRCRRHTMKCSSDALASSWARSGGRAQGDFELVVRLLCATPRSVPPAMIRHPGSSREPAARPTSVDVKNLLRLADADSSAAAVMRCGRVDRGRERSFSRSESGDGLAAAIASV